MKFTLLPYIIASASLFPYVSAAPLRIVVVTGYQEVAAAGDDYNVAKIVRPNVAITSISAAEQHIDHPTCEGIRRKALRLSNAFRQALGWPLIETESSPTVHDRYKSFMDPLPHMISGEAEGNSELHGGPESDEGHKHRHHRHHQHHHHHRHRHEHSFLARIHRAIMALGPWEGRAVAFVLGCGIGVLLRMIWVIAVVGYRYASGQGLECSYARVLVLPVEDVPPPRYASDQYGFVEVADKKIQPAQDFNA